MMEKIVIVFVLLVLTLPINILGVIFIVWDVMLLGNGVTCWFCCRRFIINVPAAATENHIRLCFQIELAYWYYLDFYVSNDAKLKGCTFKEFASHVFKVSILFEI